MDQGTLLGLLEDLRRRGSDHAGVEAKRAGRALPQNLWETISAFANGDGGVVLLGVDEQSGFLVTGVEDAAATERNLASLCQEMEPPVRAGIASLFVEGGTVVMATIPPVARDRRPCHLRQLGPYLGARLRVADGNRKLTEYEVGLLLANQREPRDDHLPVTEARVRNLDADSLAAYVSRLRSSRPSAFANRSHDEILELTNVVADSDAGVVPTLAGLLAFGTYPQQFFPQLNVSIVRYPTPVAGEPGPRGERFLDSVVIDGPIPQLLADSVAALKRNMQRRSVVMGLFRQEEWEYPEVAIREALVNALVHRDLSPGARGTQVQVELFPDRLVIRNPGGLYGPVGVDDLGLTGTSSSRNQSLLKMLSDTPTELGHTVCENVGSGIFTMRRALADAGMEPPEFRDNISTFEVVLPSHTLLDRETIEWMVELGAEGLNPPQMIALALARRGQSLTNKSFRQTTGVADSREAGRLMKDLVDRGLLAMDGSRGSASYRLPVAADAAPTLSTDAGPPLEPERAIRAALAGGSKTRREIEDATGLPRNSVIYHLRRLREAGQVELIGNERSKNTVWRLADRPS